MDIVHNMFCKQKYCWAPVWVTANHTRFYHYFLLKTNAQLCYHSFSSCGGIIVPGLSRYRYMDTNWVESCTISWVKRNSRGPNYSITQYFPSSHWRWKGELLRRTQGNFTMRSILVLKKLKKNWPSPIWKCLLQKF